MGEKENARIFVKKGRTWSKFGTGCLLGHLYRKSGVGEVSDLFKVIRGQ